MADVRTPSTIGTRIREARRQRGFRTTRELAEAMPGSKITAPILENIESGRKADLNVSQLLNIARALRLPPIYLLAPISDPETHVSLPNLSNEFSAMTSAEFDAWLAGLSPGAYKAESAAERMLIDNLNTYREMRTLQRELERVRVVRQLREGSKDPDLSDKEQTLTRRIELFTQELADLATYLREAGWNVSAEAATEDSSGAIN